MRCEPSLSQRSQQQQPLQQPLQPPSVIIAFENDSSRTDNDYSPFYDEDNSARFIDYEALLSHPVLPPNPHFFWFKQKIHITKVAKFLSILYLFIYFIGCCLIYFSGISITFLFATLLAGSVAGTTLYGVYRWKKLCLIPFFLLQIILILNLTILIIFLFYAIFVTDKSTSLGKLHQCFVGIKPFSSITWICIIIYGLFLLLLFFGYSIKLMFYEYEFIDSVDRFLKTVKRPSPNGSKDGYDQPSTVRLETPRIQL
jgi:hypothetical protein